MLFDTDILIWIERGSEKAATLVERHPRYLSILTYMELLQCALNKKQQIYTRDFIKEFGFIVLPLTENIGHRALVYVEEYSMTSGLRAGDAIIAATAVENNLTLVSSNIKHFKPIRELMLKPFVV
ncbi:type II toxin-antitoxin system VapC family toxin [candidate division KSB1 bacterium]|nr:type II toxin-antitoxin system VapC family toxin [candidate division KSB1 bacterium]